MPGGLSSFHCNLPAAVMTVSSSRFIHTQPLFSSSQVQEGKRRKCASLCKQVPKALFLMKGDTVCDSGGPTGATLAGLKSPLCSLLALILGASFHISVPLFTSLLSEAVTSTSSKDMVRIQRVSVCQVPRRGKSAWHLACAQ